MNRIGRLLVILLLLLPATGCRRSVENCKAAAEFVGLNEEQARSLARRKRVEVRVLSEGGFATSDLRNDRVNLTFDGDSVAKATYC